MQIGTRCLQVEVVIVSAAPWTSAVFFRIQVDIAHEYYTPILLDTNMSTTTVDLQTCIP